MVDGSDVLLAYKKEAADIEKVDAPIGEGVTLRTYISKAPVRDHWTKTHGGPIYMSVGEELKFNVTNHSASEVGKLSYYEKEVWEFSYSFVEYYYYKQPVTRKVEPLSGLTRGGTHIEISGAWFGYRPEYGVVPHCKLGDKVQRATYWSTVRIVCVSPPNDNINQLLDVEVSLNGVDFVNSGFKFRYYEQPILYTMKPTMGPESGGT